MILNYLYTFYVFFNLLKDGLNIYLLIYKNDLLNYLDLYFLLLN